MNLWRDPNRWVDSDMQRDETLLLARHYGCLFLAIAVLATVIAVGIGVMIS